MKIGKIYIHVMPNHKDAFLNKCAEIFGLNGNVSELRKNMSEEGYLNMIADLCFGLRCCVYRTADFAFLPACAGEHVSKPNIWRKEIWEQFASLLYSTSEIIILDTNTEIHWTFREGKLFDENEQPPTLAWDHTGRLVDPANTLPDYFYVENQEEFEALSSLFEEVYDAGVSATHIMDNPELFVLLDDTFWPVSGLEHDCKQAKALLENHLNAKEN